MMQFTDPQTIPDRARAVHARLPATVGACLEREGTRVEVPQHDSGLITFCARDMTIDFDDTDGEIHTIALPSDITDEAVAAIVYALIDVKDW